MLTLTADYRTQLLRGRTKVVAVAGRGDLHDSCEISSRAYSSLLKHDMMQDLHKATKNKKNLQLMLATVLKTNCPESSQVHMTDSIRDATLLKKNGGHRKTRYPRLKSIFLPTKVNHIQKMATIYSILSELTLRITISLHYTFKWFLKLQLLMFVAQKVLGDKLRKQFYKSLGIFCIENLKFFISTGDRGGILSLLFFFVV
ncbi:hypothetical protein RFI_33049, partial [Reticulomyxa filosa]